MMITTGVFGLGRGGPEVVRKREWVGREMRAEWWGEVVQMLGFGGVVGDIFRLWLDRLGEGWVLGFCGWGRGRDSGEVFGRRYVGRWVGGFIDELLEGRRMTNES